MILPRGILLLVSGTAFGNRGLGFSGTERPRVTTEFERSPGYCSCGLAPARRDRGIGQLPAGSAEVTAYPVGKLGLTDNVQQ